MDAAITAFLVTLGIIGGILSPIILIMVITLISNAFKAWGAKLHIKAEEIKKSPPFDDVEANLNPATRVLSVRFTKKGKVIYQGSATRNDQEAYDTVPFSKDAE